MSQELIIGPISKENVEIIKNLNGLSEKTKQLLIISSKTNSQIELNDLDITKEEIDLLQDNLIVTDSNANDFSKLELKKNQISPNDIKKAIDEINNKSLNFDNPNVDFEKIKKDIDNPKNEAITKEQLDNQKGIINNLDEEDINNNQEEIAIYQEQTDGEIEKPQDDEELQKEEYIKFMPEEVDEEKIKDMSKEEFEKMFYLTGERMAKLVDKISMETWKKMLGEEFDNNSILEFVKKLRLVYSNCTDYRLLAHPKFFDNNQYANGVLPDVLSSNSLINLHTHLLQGVYVGYYQETLDEDGIVKGIGEDGEKIDQEEIANDIDRNQVVRRKEDLYFDTLVNNRFEEYLMENMTNKLTTTVGNDIPYSVDYFERIYEDTVEETISSFKDVEQQADAKMILQSKDKRKLKDQENNLKNEPSINLNLYDIDWTSPIERAKAIESISELSSEAYSQLGLTKLLKNISVDYPINSPQDMQGFEECLKDLTALSNMDINVECACIMKPQIALMAEPEINEVFDKYPDVVRDRTAEFINMVPDIAMDIAKANAMGYTDMAHNAVDIMSSPKLPSEKVISIIKQQIYSKVPNPEIARLVENYVLKNNSLDIINEQLNDIAFSADSSIETISRLVDRSLEQYRENKEQENEMGR